MFVNLAVMRHARAVSSFSNQPRRFHLFTPALFFCLLALVGCKKQPISSDDAHSVSKKSSESVAAKGISAPVKSSGPALTPRDLERTTDIPHPDPLPKLVDEEPDPPPLPLVHFLNDRDKPELPEFTEGQLHKNSTLIILAAQPDLRARKILKPISHALSAEEKNEAIKLILAQDYKFLKLQRRRSEILAHAQTGYDVESELKQIDAETVATSMMLRSIVLKSVRNNKTN
ncbi:MAG: hypothetical protein GY880_27540 [Planctomycetaceae bacterium]|nr:hypothetical protein [Planctomycetaceae bacterium]